MKDSIPGEIMGRIVGEVANPGELTVDIKSLCLVAKSCVPYCQRVLFHSVTLKPTIIIHREGGSYTHDSITLFSTLMGSSPHIGSYVQKLTYIVLEVQTPDLGRPEFAFALEQLRNVVDFELMVDEIPLDSPLLWRGQRFKVFDSQHFEDFPRHAKALLAILERPTLNSLTLKNMELPSSTLIEATGLQTLDLRRSCIMPCRRTAAMLNPSICPTTLKLDSDASNAILAAMLRNPIIRKALGLSFSGVEELWIAAEPPEVDADEPQYATGDILRETQRLKELRLRDPCAIPANLEYSTSPLESLHPAAFESLKRLSYEIRIYMDDSATDIQDPYHGLFKNGALTSLSELEELDVKIWIGGHVHGLAINEDLRLTLVELDAAVRQRAGVRRHAQTLKKVKLSIYLDSELTNGCFLREMRLAIENQVFNGTFPELREMAKQGELELILDVEADVDPNSTSDDEEEGDDNGEDEDEEGFWDHDQGH